MRKVTLVLALAAVACFATDAFAKGSGSSCKGCHTPHRALDTREGAEYGVPLWDPEGLSDGGLMEYDLYEGSVKFKLLGITMTQPDGSSRLCLGCHDGTDYSREGGKIGWDVADGMARNHPISFVYDDTLAGKTNGTLYPPSSTRSGLDGAGMIREDLLDGKGKMQCFSCHDTHNTGVTLLPGGDHHPDWKQTKYMRFNDRGILCKTCHNK